MGRSALHSDAYRAFIVRLKQARRDSGLTQRQAAAKLGKTQSYIDKCERCERRVDATELFEFAYIYDKHISWFDPHVPDDWVDPHMPYGG